MLLRHGEASFDAPRDFDRRLTDKGRGVIGSRAQQISEYPIVVEKMMVSPYIRTLESADLLEVVTDCGERIVDESFEPDAGIAAAISALSRCEQENTGVVLVVTHQPLISDLIMFLTQHRQSMAPGDMVLIDTPAIAAGFGEIECVF